MRCTEREKKKTNVSEHTGKEDVYSFRHDSTKKEVIDGTDIGCPKMFAIYCI